MPSRREIKTPPGGLIKNEKLKIGRRPLCHSEAIAEESIRRLLASPEPAEATRILAQAYARRGSGLPDPTGRTFDANLGINYGP